MTKTIARLYVAGEWRHGAPLALPPAASHYVRDVLRLSTGAALEIFNATRGGWLARITNSTKKTVTVMPEKLVRPPIPQPTWHLYFAPIKRTNLEWLLEKATELGVTDFHPIITAHTQVKNLNTERLQAIITEATEQSERLAVPTLHAEQPLTRWLGTLTHPVLAALERQQNAVTIADACQGLTLPAHNLPSLLIGPEGGFSQAESNQLQQMPAIIKVISLGATILRAETAAIAALAQIQLAQTLRQTQ